MAIPLPKPCILTINIITNSKSRIPLSYLFKLIANLEVLCFPIFLIIDLRNSYANSSFSECESELISAPL